MHVEYHTRLRRRGGFPGNRRVSEEPCHLVGVCIIQSRGLPHSLETLPNAGAALSIYIQPLTLDTDYSLRYIDAEMNPLDYNQR